jgi:hypothetical protein
MGFYLIGLNESHAEGLLDSLFKAVALAIKTSAQDLFGCFDSHVAGS